jgi:hypothetical protein
MFRRIKEMKNAAKNFTAKNNSSARVVDGKLILSYPDALTPVVWQMDLATAKASALEVREVKNNFVLTLKTMKGETADIAPFATKDEAVAALMAASSALQNAQGNIRPMNTAANEGATISHAIPTSQPTKRGGKLATGILAVLLIVVLIGIWGSMAPRAPTSVSNAANGPTGAASAPNFGGSDEPGVPLSADEFLLKQQH